MNNNDIDLEEGELGSEEEEEEINNPRQSLPSSEEKNTTKEVTAEEYEVDYEVLPRPVKKAQRNLQPHQGQGSSRTDGVWGEPPPPEDNNNDNPSSSSSDDDSDDGQGPSANKARRMPENYFDNSSTRMSNMMSWFGSGNPDGGTTFPLSSSTSDPFKMHAAVFQQTRKVNDVWGSILREEEASDVLGRVNVDEYNEQHVLVERGPETFAVKYTNLPGPKRRIRSSSSDISSGGLTDDELTSLRGDKDQQTDEKMEGEGEEGNTLPNRFGKQKQQPISTKKLRQRRKRRNKIKNKLKKMNPNDLGRYIADKLTESKHKLITTAIEMLGKEPMIELFFKTAKIERRGGLMVLSGQRRRTPGGVFFYLLRGDTKYPKKLVDKIFAADEENQRMQRKRAYKKKRAEKLEVLKEQQSKHEQQKQEDDKAKAAHVKLEEEDKEVDVDDENMQSDHENNPEDSSSDEGEEADSDEFCGLDEHPQPMDLLTAGYGHDMRAPISYDDDSLLDIHCDASDLM